MQLIFLRMNPRRYEVFRQVFPVIIGALTGVSFGTMLGWPSTVYPLLVDPNNSPILITWDQTSLIAGFMMYGNIIGAAFSSVKLFGSRVGVLISCACQVAGWMIMYYSHNVTGVGISRGLVGFGNGFGLGQLRMYIKETCDPNIEKVVLQYMPIAMNIGVVTVFSCGTFASFRDLSLICFFIPTVALFLFAAIPKKDNVPIEESCIATVTGVIETKVSVEDKQSIKNTNEQLSFIKGLKVGEIRKCFFLSWFLVFVAQYSGGSANIVYSQVVHIAARNPYPKICAIVYAAVFLFSNFTALMYTNRFPRKPIVVTCCAICSFLSCLVCLYFYFMVDLLKISSLFAWSPVLLLSAFMFFHSAGINIIPVLFIGDRYPQNAKVIGNKFYVMYFSLSAIFSTKIFQVLFTRCGMHMTYAFLSSVALGSAIMIACFIKEPHSKGFRCVLPKIIKNLKTNSQSPKKESLEGVDHVPSNPSYDNHIDLADEVIPVTNYCANCKNAEQNKIETYNHPL